MGIMEAIKKGFGIAAKNLGLVLVLFVFNLIFNLTSLPFMPKTGETPSPQVMVMVFAFSFVFVLISIFVQGGSLGVIKDYMKAGKAKLAGILSYGAKYYLRLLGLLVFVVLIIAIAGLGAALLIAATAPLGNTVVTTIAAVIAIILGAVALYYLILLVMAPYIVICEEAGVIDSLKKSVKMVRRAIGRILLLLAILILISLGMGFLIGFVTGIITVAMPVNIGRIIVGVISSIFNGYLGVVMIGSFMVFYYGLKARENTAEKVF